MSDVAQASSPVADRIAARLSRYLGPHTARVAVKTFSQKALGRGPETISAEDVVALESALRPMLRTFIGRAQCEVVLQEIVKECGV
jgi:hypothetical protein